jgi:hypothetical protein
VCNVANGTCFTSKSTVDGLTDVGRDDRVNVLIVYRIIGCCVVTGL